MKHDDRLFGIITRRGHQHSQKALKAARAEQVSRARWYANYGMFRYACKMAALFKRGGETEWERLHEMRCSLHGNDPLITKKLTRGTRLRLVRLDAGRTGRSNTTPRFAEYTRLK